MILRRLYLYLVSAAALGTLVAGLSLLGATALLFVFNDPSAQGSRGALAGFTAATLVALPVWAVHFLFARRYAQRDPVERASAIRRLYVYWACLVLAIGLGLAIGSMFANLLRPVLDCTGPFSQPASCTFTDSRLIAAQSAWVSLVFLAFWGLHYRIAARDRTTVGEQGASATLRRWYVYPALLIGLLWMLGGASSLIELAWLRAVHGSLGVDQSRLLSDATGRLLAGLIVWGFHSGVIAARPLEDDRKSTLRALEGFAAVAICMVVALVGAGQILYYVLARGPGVNNPGDVGGDILAALAQPVSLLAVYGTAWFLIRRRLARDTGSHEVDRQAGIRRLYTNLAALVSMATMAIGAAGVLWNLAQQVESPLIGVPAGDWRDPVSRWVTLFIVGAAAWLAHWRHAPWPGDRQSLSRRLYVWAALLASVLAVLGSGIAMLTVVLQQVFSANPQLKNPDNLNFGHFLAVLLVAVTVGVYHWRVLRSDAASRPARHAPEAPPAVVAPVVAPAAAPAAPTVSSLPVEHSRGKRYILSIVAATDDDVHQALATLPPQASYHLAEQPDI